MKRLFILSHPQARQRAVESIKDAPDGYAVTIAEPRRSTDQNAAQWPILEAFSQQLQWPVNGRMETLEADEWKDILTAAFKRELTRVAPGLDGGMVLLGCRTSKFSKAKFSDWIEFLHSVAADRGVVVYQDERQAA